MSGPGGSTEYRVLARVDVGRSIVRRAGVRRWWAVAVLLGALALLVGVFAGSAAADTTTFQVRPGSWLSTGIHLAKGESFTVSATGSLHDPNTTQTWGPDGYYNLGFYAYNLKGRFGAGNNTLFDVGSGGLLFLAPIDGVLQLGVTRTYEAIGPGDGGIQGSFVAQVVTSPPSSASPSGPSTGSSPGPPAGTTSGPTSVPTSAPMTARLSCDIGALQDSGQATCTASIAGQAPNAQLGYQWALDGQPQSATGATISIGNLAPGDHQVTMTARDTANNVTADPQTASFTREPPTTGPESVVPPTTAGPSAPTTTPATGDVGVAPPPPPTGGGNPKIDMAARLALAGLSALGGAGLAEEVMRRAQAKKDAENAARSAYDQACHDLGDAKARGPQADAAVIRAKTALREIETKWKEASDYLTYRLRDDYLSLRIANAIWRGVLTMTLSIPTSGVMTEAVAAMRVLQKLAIFGSGGVAIWGMGDFDRAKWNQEVDAELKTAYEAINRIHADKVREWQDKLASFQREAEHLDQLRYEAEKTLVQLRASHPDMTFDPCPNEE